MTRQGKPGEQQRHDANARYAALHPVRARQERQLRLDQRHTAKTWAHKNQGTPETHEKASRKRQGALARLFESGAIDIDQLGSALEIASVAEQIGADVAVGTMSMETRVDGGDRGSGAFWESLGSVRREIAYTAWRASLKRPAPVLAMIVEDIGIVAAAERHHLGRRTASRLLIAALNAWPGFHADARDRIDAAELAAMQAGLV